MSDGYELKYSKSHEWVRRENDNEVSIGISDYAQNSLGDITFVELPAVGDSLTKGENFGVIESVKAASDIYAPISGEVLAVNESLEGSPEKVNESPLGEGWLIRLRIQNVAELDELLSEAEYQDQNPAP
ncbi:MAG: glycine cleavage system protein GcvH [Opitutales bacterium]